MLGDLGDNVADVFDDVRKTWNGIWSGFFRQPGSTGKTSADVETVMINVSQDIIIAQDSAITLANIANAPRNVPLWVSPNPFEDVAELVRVYNHVPPNKALFRCAWVANRPMAIHMESERLVWAPEDFEVPEPGSWWERGLVRSVRKTALWHQSLTGASAYPVGATGSDGVIVLLPDHTKGW